MSVDLPGVNPEIFKIILDKDFKSFNLFEQKDTEKEKLKNMRLEYNCPYCNKLMDGGFGENVYCESCDKTFETDWEYVTSDSIGCWLTGVEHNGKN